MKYIKEIKSAAESIIEVAASNARLRPKESSIEARTAGVTAKREAR